MCTLQTFSKLDKVCMCDYCLLCDGDLLQFQLFVLGGPLVAGEGSALPFKNYTSKASHKKSVHNTKLLTNPQFQAQMLDNSTQKILNRRYIFAFFV